MGRPDSSTEGVKSMSERWVQHKSGQGEKWKVRDCIHNQLSDKQTWVIDNDVFGLELPRSEYIECAPPEVWTDVTSSATITHPRRLDIAQIRNNDEEIVYVHLPDGYRFAWRGNALVIERRQP
jgi:hypothetical protein